MFGLVSRFLSPERDRIRTPVTQSYPAVRRSGMPKRKYIPAERAGTGSLSFQNAKNPAPKKEGKLKQFLLSQKIHQGTRKPGRLPVPAPSEPVLIHIFGPFFFHNRIIH
jgi:hypothetical protein